MKKRILRYVKHIFVSLLLFGTLLIVFGLSQGASLHYGDDAMKMNWDLDGPYVFMEDDSTLLVNYVRGNQDDGFFLDQKEYTTEQMVQASSYFPLDSSSYDFLIETDFKNPVSTYSDNGKVLAISDIESGLRTFRDFLIANKVIDEKLNWTFGQGHLVLLGDFVDRGFSTTQVLWFIYKLEQEAKEHGGFVHFILGNHELKNMQGNYDSSSPKYYHISSILDKTQRQLYDSSSVIGRWMASKNTVELINGTLFAHGGIHPEIINYDFDIDEINQIIRDSYYKPYYPKVELTKNQFLNSTSTGIAWYRGYFKDDVSQEDIESLLEKFNAKCIVVGHTLQTKVNHSYGGRVIGIDVKHPKDYHKNFPNSNSEGLLIEGNRYYRVLSNGEKLKL